MINSRTTHWHSKKTLVKDDWLSDYQLEVKQRYNLTENKVNKLLQTMFEKSKHVLHYKLLQFYVRLGLHIKKVHRILKFTKSKWLEPFFTLNSAMRKKATNRFEENYYKLMNNSVYGKTIESKRRRLKVDITRDAKKKLHNLHQNSSLTNLKYSVKNWRRSVLDQKLLNGQQQLLSGRPSWIFQNYVCKGSIMMLGAQLFGAHSCTLIPTVYCIKLRRLTSMPTWQRRKKFVQNSILQTIRTIIRSTPILNTAEFSSSRMNWLVTTSRNLYA